MNKRPLIVCSTADMVVSDVPRQVTNDAYHHSITRAGGYLVNVSYLNGDFDFTWLGRASGLLLAGGRDICPTLYGGDERDAVKPNRCRDRFEKKLITTALALDLPILGICRGMQLLNVALGGSLIGDIEREGLGEGINHNNGKSPRDADAHEIFIERGSLLSHITDALIIQVNSMHHQCIDNLAPRLRCSARAKGGIVEAVEMLEEPFVVGVQWHPEERDDVFSRNLFQQFINAASPE